MNGDDRRSHQRCKYIFSCVWKGLFLFTGTVILIYIFMLIAAVGTDRRSHYQRLFYGTAAAAAQRN